MVIDFSLECLDFIHRLYESEESIKILSALVLNKLMLSLVVLQLLLGMVLPFTGFRSCCSRQNLPSPESS